MSNLNSQTINPKDAGALDKDLMDAGGFSLDQLMELAGLSVSQAGISDLFNIPPVAIGRCRRLTMIFLHQSTKRILQVKGGIFLLLVGQGTMVKDTILLLIFDFFQLTPLSRWGRSRGSSSSCALWI